MLIYSKIERFILLPKNLLTNGIAIHSLPIKNAIPKHVGCAAIFGLMEGFLLISGYIYSLSKYN